MTLSVGGWEVFHIGEGPEFSIGTGSLTLISPRRRAATVVRLRSGGRSSSEGRRTCVTIVGR